jgi:carbonic anhydrase
MCAFFSLGLMLSAHAQGTDLPVSQAQQQAFSPDDVIESLMAGNGRFVGGQPIQRDITARIAASASGQHPKAVILSCLDSRVPVEKVFDVSIGDVFVGRVAGNIVNEDQLGSMEFATKLAGAKLVMVLGHSECGAVKGAIDGARLGNLTALLAKIQPAIQSVEGFPSTQRNSANAAFVQEVIGQNVREMIRKIRERSEVLADLEEAGQIKIVGALYDLHSGRVSLIE